MLFKRKEKKSKNTPRKNKKNKLSTFEFYTELLFSLIAGGNIDKPDENTIIREGEFYYSTNKIFTKDKIKKVLFIVELPDNMEKKLLKELKNDVKEYGDINIIKILEPYTLNMNSFKIRSRINMWKKKYERFEEEVYSRSNAEELFSDQEQKELDRRTSRMIKSWAWVQDSIRNKDKFCRFTLILELVTDSLTKLYNMEKIVKEKLYLLEVGFNSIFVQTNEYYKTFSVAGKHEDTLLKRMVGNTILTDRTVAQTFSAPNGVAGDKDGLYFGTDVFTSLPLTYNLKKGSDAVNFVITAESGGGKSNYCKGLMTHLELEDIYSINIDYEGDEYTDIGLAHNAVIINMNPEESTYFDTVEIGDLTGDDKIDRALKDEAIQTTKLVFDVLADYKNGMNYRELDIFNRAIDRVYKNAGVTEDKRTWKNSKGLQFIDIYNEIKYMRNEVEYMERVEEISDFITKLSVYFEDYGIYKNIFRNKVSINDILGHKRVIFSFGMRGKTESSIDKRSLALRQLFTGYLIMLIANYNKSVLGRLTAVFLEELQRFMNHESSGQIVNDIVSGGRKRNMITFLITNSPLQLLDLLEEDDKSDLSKHTKAIKNNIQGLILGKLKDRTSERIVQSFPEISECLPELELINKDPDFKYCFLVHYRGESSIVKFEIPPSLINTSMYVTRTDQKE